MYELGKYIFDNLKDALFPHHCVCGKWGSILCPECEANLIISRAELCPICKKLSPWGKTCDTCRSRSALTGVMIAGPHKGVLKSLIWKLKYGPVIDVSEALGALFAAKYNSFLTQKKPIITFVPTSRERQRLRGYNQSRELAKYLAEESNLDIVDVLARPKDTLHQVGLTRRERLENAAGTIQYIGEVAGKNKRIVIVDDVYTTGATLEECAKVLRKNGYREVWGMVLSRD